MQAGMEHSPYILVAGGQQLQLPVAASSAGAVASLTKANSGHAIVVSNAHIANLTAGKSLLNVRTVGPNPAGSWKPGEPANRPMNTQTHPVRYIVTNSKDGFVAVPNFASLTSGGGVQGAAAANPNNAAAASNSRVAFVKHSSAGAVQKIAPAAAAAANFLAPVPNGSLRAAIPGGNKLPVRTLSPMASFANSGAAVVPKTAGAVWGSLSAANSIVTSSSAPVSSPSKQVIIQLAPEQLVCCLHCVLFSRKNVWCFVDLQFDVDHCICPVCTAGQVKLITDFMNNLIGQQKVIQLI